MTIHAQVESPGIHKAAPTLLRRLYHLPKYTLALLGVIMILYQCFFHISRVSSQGMTPVLQSPNWRDADRVLTEKISYRFRRPRRFEVVTVRRGDIFEMKRVIALPGEQLQVLRSGQIKIDGQPLELPAELSHLKPLAFGNLIAGQVVTLDDGYYLMGDNYKDFEDSRFLGPFSRTDIVGRAWLRVGPNGRRGFVR